MAASNTSLFWQNDLIHYLVKTLTDHRKKMMNYFDEKQTLCYNQHINFSFLNLSLFHFIEYKDKYDMAFIPYDLEQSCQ